MLRLIDSHCHLISHKFTAGETPELVQRAIDAGVDRMIGTGTEVDNWDDYLQLAAQFPQHVFCSLGIHPTDVHEAPDNWKELLRQIALDGKMVALGETGLDYYHPAPEGWNTGDFRKRQQEFLRDHFMIADEAGLNVVIHTRDRSGSDSFEDALEIAAEFAGKVRPMFHCFIGNREQAQRVMDLNGMVSFTGILTFKNAADVLDVARWCPPGTFLLETDAPYLAPTPFRGQRNEPSYVLFTARELAAARGESLEKLAEITTKTAESFFKL